MPNRNIRLEMKPNGSVLDCRVFLENQGNPIGLWRYDSQKGVYFKNLPDYSIVGNSLEVKMIAWGKNGASTSLRINIQGQEANTLTCVIQEGSDTEETSITIQNIV